MKRVAVIAIFMAVMASLFAFPTFAETDFGYSVSVSNQDSINGVVITLKANRGSLVNSGTAALGYSGYCPVLVTVTLQNTNNQNVLINNLKFKLTTNSSGNFSRIVSFEQLSSDLIVAETPYDLNNYISIVPNSQYSYGTGIVVPANSSMYMVCIMNVYANYDTSTNQWQVPSLQYIGYDQNITVTTGNYHSSGVPVDLTQVVDALNDLINNVSTSDELQDIIDLITYTGNSDTSLNLNTESFSVATATYNNVEINVRRYVCQEYVVSRDFEIDPSTNQLYTYQTYCIPVIVQVYIRNLNAYPVKANKSVINVNNLLPKRAEPESVYSTIFSTIGPHTDSYAISYLYYQNIENGVGIIPSGSSTSIFTFNLYYSNKSEYSPTFYNMSIPSLSFSKYQDDVYIDSNNLALNKIFKLIKSWYDSYQDVNGLDDIDDTSYEITGKSENAHTQEQSYFIQNAQAIQQTGLSNYRFNGDQENGIGSVSHDFTLLWNALGGFNSIYIFSLTLSLALMILRHAPSAIKSSRRNKEE